MYSFSPSIAFLLTPLREGRPRRFPAARQRTHFYSRPCGRGDSSDGFENVNTNGFLLTPLREGRRPQRRRRTLQRSFLLTPLREGRQGARQGKRPTGQFLLTPLREGRPAPAAQAMMSARHFYSRPCGRGDASAYRTGCWPAISTHAPAGGATSFFRLPLSSSSISTHAPAGGATVGINVRRERVGIISTHAPAGGATAIFHKSVMRFCGKLPKDDTVLCLASFGFPRRDPKAVYLAWISCANLPQKCVRQGLALKDQGTSCFHEGLASHAFDPVLV